MASSASVTPVRASARNILLTSERTASISALTGVDVDPDLVYEADTQWKFARLRESGSDGVDMNPPAGSKANLTFDEGEKCVVFAHTNVVARMEFGSALPNDNISSDDIFTTVLFDATILGI